MFSRAWKNKSPPPSVWLEWAQTVRTDVSLLTPTELGESMFSLVYWQHFLVDIFLFRLEITSFAFLTGSRERWWAPGWWSLFVQGAILFMPCQLLGTLLTPQGERTSSSDAPSPFFLFPTPSLPLCWLKPRGGPLEAIFPNKWSTKETILFQTSVVHYCSGIKNAVQFASPPACAIST